MTAKPTLMGNGLLMEIEMVMHLKTDSKKHLGLRTD
jgi:hypothetical protein